VLNPVANVRVDHAWVLLSERSPQLVYDAVLDQYFTERQYAERHKAVVSRIYTQMEAAKASIEQGHYGPWT
jgi:hypothetical protein